jgi:hypothetical protein
LDTVELVTGAAGGWPEGGATGDFGARETGALTVDVVGPTWAAEASWLGAGSWPCAPVELAVVVVEGAVVVVGAIVVVVGEPEAPLVVADVVVVLGAVVVVVVDALGLRVVEVVASAVVVVVLLSPGWSGGCWGAAPASPINAPAMTPLTSKAVPVMANRRLMRRWRSIRSLRPDRFWNPVRNNYRKTTTGNISRKRGQFRARCEVSGGWPRRRW